MDEGQVLRGACLHHGRRGISGQCERGIHVAVAQLGESIGVRQKARHHVVERHSVGLEQEVRERYGRSSGRPDREPPAIQFRKRGHTAARPGNQVQYAGMQRTCRQDIQGRLIRPFSPVGEVRQIGVGQGHLEFPAPHQPGVFQRTPGDDGHHGDAVRVPGHEACKPLPERVVRPAQCSGAEAEFFPVCRRCAGCDHRGGSEYDEPMHSHDTWTLAENAMLARQKGQADIRCRIDSMIGVWVVPDPGRIDTRVPAGRSCGRARQNPGGTGRRRDRLP